MRAFPIGYWAIIERWIPGGGVSEKMVHSSRMIDHGDEGESFVQNTTSGSTSSVVAVVREMTEELGVVPNGGNGEEIPFEYVNDGGADCADGADEQQCDGNEINFMVIDVRGRKLRKNT